MRRNATTLSFLYWDVLLSPCAFDVGERVPLSERLLAFAAPCSDGDAGKDRAEVGGRLADNGADPEGDRRPSCDASQPVNAVGRTLSRGAGLTPSFHSINT